MVRSHFSSSRVPTMALHVCSLMSQTVQKTRSSAGRRGPVTSSSDTGPKIDGVRAPREEDSEQSWQNSDDDSSSLLVVRDIPTNVTFL